MLFDSLIPDCLKIYFLNMWISSDIEIQGDMLFLFLDLFMFFMFMKRMSCHNLMQKACNWVFYLCLFFFVFVYFLFNLPPIGARKWSTLLLLLMGSSWSTCIRKLSRDSSNTDFISIGFCLKRYTDRLWGDLQGMYSPRVSLEL